MNLPIPDLRAAARLGFSEPASTEAMLWDDLDLDDPDDRRFGNYELLERIGRGGMGVVFRARQLSLEREVAVKFIVGDLAYNPQAVARFLDEARAAARLHHPNIVPVFEVGTVEGMHFFSMPLLRGQTLAERSTTKQLSTGDCVDLLLKLGAAVDYAHSLGLLHLDLKPANVLFDQHDQPLIGDFGLARHMDEAGGVDALDVSGTPAYMAPEQLRTVDHRLSVRTDVYALGAILHELLAGDKSGTRVDLDLEAICRKCLQRNPDQRYQTAFEFSADLARFRDGHDVSARRPGWRETAARSVRRHPAIGLATAAALVALLLGLATTSWQWRQAEAARARTQQLAGLMSAAFPTDDSLSDERATSARNAVAWLKQHVPDDPGAQREVLTAFREALTADNKGEAVAVLMNEIFDQFGEDYRRTQVERLVKMGDRDSLIAAALLGVPRGTGGISSAAHEAALQRLFAQHSDDQLALYAAALACHGQPQPCAHPEYFALLVERFPDNAVNWVVAPQGSASTEKELVSRMRSAALASEFDDHLAVFTTLMRAALRDQSVPDATLLPMQAFVGEADVARSLRRNAVDSVALPNYGPFLRLCKPASIAALDVAGLHEACGAFAQNGMRSSGASILARMISSAMLRRLYTGTPLEIEAYEYRRQYVWLSEQVWPDITGNEPANSEQILQDLALYGEWEAWQRHAERMGKPRMPPLGWLPANPQSLRLAEDRTPSVPRP